MNNPVFILGSPRAGTSVLGRLLEAHPALCHVKEPRLVWRYGNDHRSDVLAAECARPEVANHIRSYFKSKVDESGADLRLLEKTPSNSLRVPFIEKIFPNAKYVHITRNGFDASLSIRHYWLQFTKGVSQGRRGSSQSILSQRIQEMRFKQIPYYLPELIARVTAKPGGSPRTMWGPRLPGMKQMVRDMNLLEVAALQWRTCVESARIDAQRLAPERYFELRLEDLNEEALIDILEFLQLDYHADVKDYFANEFISNKTESRRSEITEDDRICLRRVLTPTMNWLGYDEV